MGPAMEVSVQSGYEAVCAAGPWERGEIAWDYQAFAIALLLVLKRK